MCGELQMGIGWVHWNQIPESCVVSACLDKQSLSAPTAFALFSLLQRDVKH